MQKANFLNSFESQKKYKKEQIINTTVQGNNMEKEKFLKLGAEARLTTKGDVLIKHRIKKSYRVKEIDEPLRKTRTATEANLMERAKRAKVTVPKILNLDKENTTIEMELINGKRIDLCLTSANAKKTGASIGKLHQAGIIHGDLTTSNILVSGSWSVVHGKKKKLQTTNHEPQTTIYLIDFGLGELSEAVEKRGVDVRVFKESINATKPDKLDVLMKAFWEGYKKECTEWEQVQERLGKIEKRGRYKEN
jgi:Kae1-associated kinase Bud32